MLAYIVQTALRFRVLVVALAVALLLLGSRAARNAPLDVFPEFAPPMVEVQTEAPGLSTEEVENLVTVPLENALNGVPWLERLRSKSVLGLSSVVLIFQEGTDPLRARQIVQERLATEASRLPAAAHAPVLLPPLSSLSRVMKIGISSATLSQVEMTDRVRWTVRPRLMAVRGVANVTIWGQRDRQLQVLVDPDRLAACGVRLSEVTRAAGDAVVIGAGGFIDTPNQRLPVRHLAPVETVEDLGRALVATRNGVAIRLADVATVIEGHAVPIGDAVINDGAGLLLIVEKQPWGNTLEVTRGVDEALELLAPSLVGMDVDPTIFRPATFVERSLRNLSHAMWLGCALVALILALFLFEWRTALISMAAIPLSLLSAALFLRIHGSTLNVMTIAGLVIAIGEVVDDAIIDVENITRRWRQILPRTAAQAFRVVLDASIEVRGAVVYASLIVILVFVPVFFLDGLAGSFFRPLALAYVGAIFASLVVALTVTPALCLLLFRGRPPTSRESPLVRLLKAIYSRILPPVIRHPRLVAGLLVPAIGFSAFGVTRLGEEFLPSFRETDFLMHFVEKPGTSLSAMSRVTVVAGQDLRKVPGVRNFGAHIGRAEVADEVVGPNFTELWISIDEDAPYDATIARVQEVIDEFPGLYRDLLTYLRERVKEVLTGASASIVVRVFGDDLERIRSRAHEIAAQLDGIDGVTELKVEAQSLVPQVTVRLLSEVAAQHGATAADVHGTLATYLQGLVVGQLHDARKSTDVVVIGEPSGRLDVTSIRRLRVDLSGGETIPMEDVAEVRIDAMPNEIKREGGSRRIDVTCNVGDADLGEVARAVQGVVDRASFSNGDHAEVLGEYQERQRSQNRLALLALASLLGILLLLHADMESWRPALLIFATLPLALIGGVGGAWLGGGTLSLGSLVGFVTVLGIAARNGILLVSHYRRLESEGVDVEHGLLIRGARERLSPILMTALCAGLGLLPLALSGDVPGHEIEHPLAVVILGGLASSTVLNLLVVPSLYGWLMRPAPRAEPEART